jgi:NDP-sugar pyrophosphorylase family protein
MKAIILAGGLGTRLKPFTEVIPKPLLPIGEKAIIEVQIENLKKHGFDEIIVATNYRSKYVESYLGDGSQYGVRLKFSLEEKQLGTVGPLSLLEEELNEPFLLMNGDILTKANFKEIYDFSLEFEDSNLTVVTKEIITPFRFGSVETEGDYLINVAEKPELHINILAGIYIMKPSIFTHIPRGKRYDMNILIEKLLKTGEKVTVYQLKEYWLDIGRYDDYEKAQKDINQFI